MVHPTQSVASLIVVLLSAVFALGCGTTSLESDPTRVGRYSFEFVVESPTLEWGSRDGNRVTVVVTDRFGERLAEGEPVVLWADDPGNVNRTEPGIYPMVEVVDESGTATFDVYCSGPTVLLSAEYDGVASPNTASFDCVDCAVQSLEIEFGTVDIASHTVEATVRAEGTGGEFVDQPLDLYIALEGGVFSNGLSTQIRMLENGEIDLLALLWPEVESIEVCATLSSSCYHWEECRVLDLWEWRAEPACQIVEARNVTHGRDGWYGNFRVALSDEFGSADGQSEVFFEADETFFIPPYGDEDGTHEWSAVTRSGDDSAILLRGERPPPAGDLRGYALIGGVRGDVHRVECDFDSVVWD